MTASIALHNQMRFALGRPLGRVVLSVLAATKSVLVAFFTAWVVAGLANASGPVELEVAIPADEHRPTWNEQRAAFSSRLEDVFGLDEERSTEFSGWILEASTRQDLPPELIASLIYTESTFRTRVRSWAGAVGPAQVKPGIWSDFCGGADLLEPEANVLCGAQILAHYMEQCGEFECAIRLYNVGPSNLRDPYYRTASSRYLAKIETHHGRMTDVPLL